MELEDSPAIDKGRLEIWKENIQAVKTFSTNTDVFHFGTPLPMDYESGMALLNKEFSKMRDAINATD